MNKKFLLDSIGPYRIYSSSVGHEIAKVSPGETQSVFLQGDESDLFRAEFDERYTDHQTPNTRANRLTWLENMDEMVGGYFDF